MKLVINFFRCLNVLIVRNFKDGNEEGNESTNGTWIYALDDIEIKDGMKFKSNSCNFVCRLE